MTYILAFGRFLRIVEVMNSGRIFDTPLYNVRAGSGLVVLVLKRRKIRFRWKDRQSKTILR